jgi:hypothetical protein
MFNLTLNGFYIRWNTNNILYSDIIIHCAILW